MKPVSPVIRGIDEVIYAKNQTSYKPLPVIKCQDGTVISRWKLSFREIIKIIWSRSIFLKVATFNTPLQPVNLSVEQPKLMVE